MTRFKPWVTTLVPKEHLKSLGEVVIGHQKTSCVTSSKEWVFLLESFQEIVHAVFIDEVTARIVLITFLRHCHHYSFIVGKLKLISVLTLILLLSIL